MCCSCVLWLPANYVHHVTMIYHLYTKLSSGTLALHGSFRTDCFEPSVELQSSMHTVSTSTVRGLLQYLHMKCMALLVLLGVPMKRKKHFERAALLNIFRTTNPTNPILSHATCKIQFVGSKAIQPLGFRATSVGSVAYVSRFIV